MSAFNTIFAQSAVTLMAVFGESVTYRQLGHEDIVCTAIWTDETPEASQPGVLGRADIAVSGFSFTPAAGDLIIRGSDTFRVVEPIVSDGQFWKLQVRK